MAIDLYTKRAAEILDVHVEPDQGDMAVWGTELERNIAATAEGIRWGQAVRVRSTANVNLANGLENGDTLNGVTLATGDYVLLVAQTAPAENGIYTVVASGAASRATYADTAAELARLGVLVRQGTVGAGERWTLSMDAASINLGVTALNWWMIGGEVDLGSEIQDEIDAVQSRLDVVEDDRRQVETKVDTVTFASMLPPAYRLTGGVENASSGYESYMGFGSALAKADLTGNINALRIVRSAAIVAEGEEAARIYAEVRDVSTGGSVVASGMLNIDPLQRERGDIVIPITLFNPATKTGPLIPLIWAVTKDGSPATIGFPLAVTPPDAWTGDTYVMSKSNPGVWTSSDIGFFGIEVIGILDGVQETVTYTSGRERPVDSEPDLVCMPSRLNSTYGTEFNVYFDNCGLSRQAEYVSFCDGGDQMDRRFTFLIEREDLIGGYGLRVEAFDPHTGVRLGNSLSIINRIIDDAGDGETLTISHQGDSTTEYQASFAGGNYRRGFIEALYDRAASDATANKGPAITLVGLRGTGNYKHDGLSGTTLDWLYNSESSPIVFGGIIDIPAFAAERGISELDLFVDSHGINDVRGMTDDGAVLSKAANAAVKLETIFEAVKAWDSDCACLYNAPIMPALEQNAFGVQNRSSPYDRSRMPVTWRDRRNLLLWSRVFKRQFDGRESEGIYFRMPGLGIDPVNNFTRTRPQKANERVAIAGTFATYAAMLADLTPADGLLYYVADIGLFYAKMGATNKGGWRAADETDGIVRIQDDCYHPAASGFEQYADAHLSFCKWLVA